MAVVQLVLVIPLVDSFVVVAAIVCLHLAEHRQWGLLSVVEGLDSC